MRSNVTILLMAVMLISCRSEHVNVNIDEMPNSDTMYQAQITQKAFGKADNKDIFLFSLTNTNGIEVKITNYGAIITSIRMPDRAGKYGDIVLGYDSLDQYIANNPYFGAIVGRYANRISKGRFTLKGKEHQLSVNNGKNSLHGGLKGFDKVVWEPRIFNQGQTGNVLELSYLSKDGEEGYPGNLQVKVTYTLNDNDELITLIEAETDKPTPVNLCNHSYFNLSEADTSILGHILTLYADFYTEVDGDLIPTGRMPSVSGTPMDFNTSNAIGERIDKVRGGYDHNFVLDKTRGNLEMAAQLYDPRSGRQLEILTTQPGIQFYSGNFLDGTIKGKKGKIYHKHYGLCLETQHFPDSPNHPSFPNTILKPGEKFSEKTIFRFSVLP